MKVCIICRQGKDEKEFNDEHVIPDSINGYYHIKSVCTKCNSTLGSKIDNKLTNHQFISFQRHTLKIAGKSGKVPNPFAGTHILKDDSNQKVRLDFEDGKLEVKLLPNISNEIAENFQIKIDKKDEHKVDEIIDKFLTRNGIPKDKVKIQKSESSAFQPWVQASMKIDIKDFKMAMLKIAYEFAVDTIPTYFDDPNSKVISNVLETCDFQNLYSKVKFLGDGFNKEILKPFSHLIDFESDNHYLVLCDIPNIGLICIVNLFSVFNLGVKLSDKNGFIPESIIVGKNDLGTKTFEKFSMAKLFSHVYSPINYTFYYFLTNVQEFLDNEKHPDFSFYRVGHNTPFFNKDGQIKYSDINDKIHQRHLNRIESGDEINDLITDITLDEELYLKVLPINKLYRVIAVRLEQHNIRKI